MVYREKKERGITRLTGATLAAWPIDSVYISLSAANPATLFGGTWIALATGRMLIGVNPGDPDYDAAGDVGGAKTVVLTAGQIPDHTHPAGSLAATNSGGHGHNVNRRASAGTAGGGVAHGAGSLADDLALSGGAHDHSIGGSTATQSGTNNQAHNNMPPFLAVYMWRRTA